MEAEWGAVKPVGREFGSPDYERLNALDHLAFTAFGSWREARAWLVIPSLLLDGMSPQDAARTDLGFERAKALLKDVRPSV